MGISKSNRIIILLVVDTAFFLLELIVGTAVGSLALVADSFHMLNDVISLCVGLWAVKRATSSTRTSTYTYGWQRAETLGALVNGVFLIALCLSIFLEAIQRFFDPQEITHPQLILRVGCAGLASNILGLALFHDHSHGHGHGGHSHGHEHVDEIRATEEGHSHYHHQHDGPSDEHVTGNSKSTTRVTTPKRGNTTASSGEDHHEAFTRSDEEVSTAASASSPMKSQSFSSPSRRMRSASNTRARYESIDSVYTYPAMRRQQIIERGGQLDDTGSITSSDSEGDPYEETIPEESEAPTEGAPLLKHRRKSHPKKDRAIESRKSISTTHKHASHIHRQPKENDAKSGGHSHGHSHGDLNMRGVFLHVMGDALGNIGVIATGLVIWLTDYSWRFYFDPIVSLVITVIILISAVPLCKAASRILLQAVPSGLSVDDIQTDIEDLEGVVSCHHLHVWQLSDTKLIASLHVQVEFAYDEADAHQYMKLAKDIRTCLHEYGIHSSTIQPEFCLNNDHDHVKRSGSHGDGDSSEAGQTRDRAGNKTNMSRDASIRSLPDACLLDCGDECGDGKSCCDPGKPAGA